MGSTFKAPVTQKHVDLRSIAVATHLFDCGSQRKSFIIAWSSHATATFMLTFTYPDSFFGEVSRGNLLEKQITLTFDGGGGESFTGAILETFEARKIPITAFLTGAFMTQHPADTRLLHEHGHEVGNHSMTHPWFAKEASWRTAHAFTRERFVAELSRVQGLFHEITKGELCPFWRAPFGSRSLELLSWGQELGLTHAYWTNDTADWRVDLSDPLSKSGAKIVEELMDFEQNTPHGLNGAIILMHLGAQRSVDPLMQHLESFCDVLADRGYRFVNLSTLYAKSTGRILAGDLPLPSNWQIPAPPEFHQVGAVHEGYADGWLGPRFSVKFETTGSFSEISFDLFVPELLERQSVAAYANGASISTIECTPGNVTRVVVPLTTTTTTADLHFSHFVSPFLSSEGDDKRYLSAILSGISLG